MRLDKVMNTSINNLGECTYKSPLIEKYPVMESAFVSDDLRTRFDCYVDGKEDCSSTTAFEIAGPREKIYFNPSYVCSAIVTCGGLSPGINDVIRSIVMQSHFQYGVKSVLGIRYGYNGLNPGMGYEPMELTPMTVRDIHVDGGTILGSSRGGTEDMNLLVDRLEKLGVSILYTIGGDGTLKGANELAAIINDRGIDIAVVGVPKTIDNDISYIQRTFGFETAVSNAVKAIYSAHVEAKGAPNGIGLVKLMGRHSGFIAANSTLAMNDVNFLLIPEVPFNLDGENGFFKHLDERLSKRGHAVICVAEGAGQDLLVNDKDGQARDASGNVVLADIGMYLRDKIKEYFKKREKTINLKYIDPSYMIRSAPAGASDSIFCALLGQYAVHAAMAGKTDLVIGQWNNIYTHMPIELVISKRKQIDPNSRFWYNVMDATGQPFSMTD